MLLGVQGFDKGNITVQLIEKDFELEACIR